MKKILLILTGLSVGLFAGARYERDAETGIVIDSETHLQWQDDTVSTTTTWQGAIDKCEALVLGSRDDWRLPNLNELTSLVDGSRVSPAISTVFVYTVSDNYWSSTTYAGDTGNAFNVYFKSGAQGYRGKGDGNGYVRCVRAGK